MRLLALYLVAIAHVDCCVAVPAAVMVAAGATIADVDCTDDGFVGPHVAFVVIFILTSLLLLL